MTVFIVFQDRGYRQNPVIVGVFPSLALAKEHLSTFDDFIEFPESFYIDEWHGTHYENTYYF